MAESSEVRILSKSLIRPSPRLCEEDGGRLIHLTPWDLMLLSIDYIQKGILFRRPPTQDADMTLTISRLRDSFAAALDRFFPLAGRLSIANLDTSPPSLSISLKCNDEGADFIHASAPSVTVSSILHSLYVPPVVLSFFPLNRALSYDGHRLPLLATQVTELADGIFIACSLNHAVADGTVFWNFFNSWSQICRSGGCPEVSIPPAIDRWFLDSCIPPIRLPFGGENDFIRRPVYPPVEECVFHFSAAAVAKLKSMVNAEMGTDGQISSLQSLLSLIWVSVTRARRLDPNKETSYMILIGCRTRLTPPLPESYLGNAVHVAATQNVTAGELLQRGLGWAAWQLNQTVALFKESLVRSCLADWVRTPSFSYACTFKPEDLLTGGSPRFNVYGNDFGWGRPVGVRSGAGNKGDGKVTVYPGPEKGSIAVEVCLSPKTLSALIKDEELMRMVSCI
ncbi:LOW QUALITY PROTEIN: putative acetyltransferase At3g50280 [Curcuma longa]|uniref:LOW QUALITY PROTEIN: putative acetyltransferase At3g50280 n=1 Tax=Curcuma longa TaxID=136217 RepID=UPI003D9E0484